jgi:hypothetical protein
MKWIWRIGQALCLVLYGFSIYMWIAWGKWWLFAAIALLHFSEVWIKGLGVGERLNKSWTYSLIMTMLFGFVWWLPAEKGWI